MIVTTGGGFGICFLFSAIDLNADQLFKFRQDQSKMIVGLTMEGEDRVKMLEWGARRILGAHSVCTTIKNESQVID